MDARDIKQIGPYPVNRMIAEGGMSWVFEVEDPRFGVRRALKMLKRGVAAGLEYERFQAEVRVLARIEHPNVITIYDFGSDEKLDCDYYTMTFVAGATLEEKTGLPPHEAASIFLDVLMGLAQLHDANVTHRDLKPANVVLTPDGRAVLIDLGIVHVEDQPAMTAPGVAMGTVLYMSPEQALGKKVGPTSDIFAAGLTLFHLLTGRSVYDAVPELEDLSSQAVLMYLGSLHHSGRELQFEFPSNVPKGIREVVERACRMQPEDRFPDARAMHETLRAAIEPPDPGHTQILSTADVRRVAQEAAGTPATRRSRVLAGSALGVVASAAAGVWMGIQVGWWSPFEVETPTGVEAVTEETATVNEPPQAAADVPAPLTSFGRTFEALLEAQGPWTELDVLFRAAPNPVRLGKPYTLLVEADCDCWPLIFSIDGANEEITLVYPNELDPPRHLGAGTQRIPTPPDELFGGGGGILRAAHTPGSETLKLILLEPAEDFQLRLPVRAEGEGMWRADAGKPERLEELQQLLDGLSNLRWTSKTVHLETIP